MKFLAALSLFVLSTSSWAQSQTKRALFVGNSYTYFNDLPKMVADMALSTGDTLIYDSSTPGGYTLQGHSTNGTTLGKITSNTWDYIALQEQSQRPSFPISQVQSNVFPYARTLDSIINLSDSCTETIFFMTWGRKNGDASNCAFFPPLCTYEGMDSLLNLRYRMMTDSNDAILSPVGALWNYIRQNHPSIELYTADESHPSLAGSYAAACSFYSVIFRKDPTLITFSSSLDSVDALNIRNAAKNVVYNDFSAWHVGEYDPVINNILVTQLGFSTGFSFEAIATNASDYFWDFADGNTGAGRIISHTYTNYSAGDTVWLVARSCGRTDTSFLVLPFIDLVEFSNIKPHWNTYPNPASSQLQISLEIPGSLSFGILNSNGSIICKGELVNNKSKIDISKLPPGLYILHLQDGNQSLGHRSFMKIE